MVSTRKKRHSYRRFFGQLDDYDQDAITGDAASGRQQNVVSNDGTVDQEFTVDNNDSNLTAIENVVIVQTLERFFNERIDREMVNIVEPVEYRIENAILTAIDNIITPRIEVAVRSIYASSGRDATSVTASSERGGRM